MKFKLYGKKTYKTVKFLIIIISISILIFSVALIRITNISKILLYANNLGMLFIFWLYSHYSSYRNYSINIEFLSDNLEIYTKSRGTSLKYILKYCDIKNVAIEENMIFIGKNNTEKFILIQNIIEQDSEKLKSLFDHLSEYGLPFDEEHANSLLKINLNQEKRRKRMANLGLPFLIVLICLLIIFAYKIS